MNTRRLTKLGQTELSLPFAEPRRADPLATLTPLPAAQGGWKVWSELRRLVRQRSTVEREKYYTRSRLCLDRTSVKRSKRKQQQQPSITSLQPSKSGHVIQLQLPRRKWWSPSGIQETIHITHTLYYG